MDAIYTLAKLNIIALTDGHSSIGLPGNPNQSRELGKLTNLHGWSFWEISDSQLDQVHVAMPKQTLVESPQWNSQRLGIPGRNTF